MKYLDILEPSRAQAKIGIVGLVVFQSEFAADLATVLIVPCFPFSANLDAGLLTPKIAINGRNALVLMHQIAAVRRSGLKSSVVGNAHSIRYDLLRAIDLLVTGV